MEALKRHGRDAVLCLSFANLCFLSIWAAFQDRTMLYYRSIPPGYAEVAAVTADVVLMGALLYLGVLGVERSRNRWVQGAARIAFLGAMLVPLRNIRWAAFEEVSTRGLRTFLGRGGIVLSVILILVAVVIWNRRLVKVAAVFLLILAPLLPINVFRSLEMAYSLKQGAYRELPPPPDARDRPVAAKRVVVLLFDELDYRAAFSSRPTGLRLPELDRLREESVFAVKAFPAQSETMLSIPAILSDRDVATATHFSSADLKLISGNSTVEWSRVPNLFSQLRSRGVRTGLVGWYHPYCRILGNSLDECFYEPCVFDHPELKFALPVLTNMRLNARRMLATIPPSRLFEQSVVVSLPERIREYVEIHRHALAAAKDKTLGFVFLHYPIPHPPGIFDLVHDRLSPGKTHPYVDNLALVDRSLGELRAAMEQAGVWDSTTLVVTSDHPLRVPAWPEEVATWKATSPLVPLMVKLEGQHEGVTYTAPINNRILHDLVLEQLAADGFRDPRELVQWLASHPPATTVETAAQHVAPRAGEIQSR